MRSVVRIRRRAEKDCGSHPFRLFKVLFARVNRDRPRCLRPSAALTWRELWPCSLHPSTGLPRARAYYFAAAADSASLPRVTASPASAWRFFFLPCCQAWLPLPRAPVAAAVSLATGRGARPRLARGGWRRHAPLGHQRRHPPRLPRPLAHLRVLSAALATRRRRRRVRPRPQRVLPSHPRRRRQHPAPMPRFVMPYRPM